MAMAAAHTDAGFDFLADPVDRFPLPDLAETSLAQAAAADPDLTKNTAESSIEEVANTVLTLDLGLSRECHGLPMRGTELEQQSEADASPLPSLLARSDHRGSVAYQTLQVPLMNQCASLELSVSDAQRAAAENYPQAQASRIHGTNEGTELPEQTHDLAMLTHSRSLTLSSADSHQSFEADEIQAAYLSAGCNAAGSANEQSLQLAVTDGCDSLELPQAGATKSSVKDDPHGWTRRIRIRGASSERTPCPGRVCALEKTFRGYAERKTETVVVPAVGDTFDSLGEAYDYYNLYSWEIGFGIRYGKSRLCKKAKRPCMQEIVCGCSVSDF